jgi:hypothetical protein
VSRLEFAKWAKLGIEPASPNDRIEPHSDISGRFLLRCTGLACYTCLVISGLWVSPMRRREFITLLGGALADQAIPANAEEPVRVRTVGALMGFANDADAKAVPRPSNKVLKKKDGRSAKTWVLSTAMPKATPRASRHSPKLVEFKPDCILGQSTPVTSR